MTKYESLLQVEKYTEITEISIQIECMSSMSDRMLKVFICVQL